MIALGFAVAWAGYTTFMWGYCLVRDYDVTVPDLFKATWPGQLKAGTGKGTVSGPVTPAKSGQPPPGQQFLGG